MSSNEKTLNELKKATMASYLAKAGKAVRSGTSIAASFDDDYHKNLKVANQNHPNVYTPGVEKDAEKLKKAEAGMKTNAELRDKFKLGAANRIKGIARAGRLLTKEDAVNELKKSTLGSYIKKAADDKADRQSYYDYPSYDRDADENERKLGKRTAGIKKAVDKLTKEDRSELVKLALESFKARRSKGVTKV